MKERLLLLSRFLLISVHGLSLRCTYYLDHPPLSIHHYHCRRWFHLSASKEDKSQYFFAEIDSTSPSASPILHSAEFGQVVPLRRPSNSTVVVVPSLSSSSTTFGSSAATSQTPAVPTLESIRRRNLFTACIAIGMAVLSYLWQFTHPSSHYSPIQLLLQLQASSNDLSIIGSNDRPTVVDFWAPWCENCKLEAATLQSIQQKYAGRVNFVMVNGDDPSPRSGLAIDSFGVDAVPHIALVAPDGQVQTALIGIIPQKVIEADLDALLQWPKSAITTTDGTAEEEEKNSQQLPQLPYTMLDTFAYRPEQRKLHFDPPDII